MYQTMITTPQPMYSLFRPLSYQGRMLPDAAMQGQVQQCQAALKQDLARHGLAVLPSPALPSPVLPRRSVVCHTTGSRSGNCCSG